MNDSLFIHRKNLPLLWIRSKTSVDGSWDGFSQVEILLSAQQFLQHPCQRESAHAGITCRFMITNCLHMKSQHLRLLLSAALSEVRTYYLMSIISFQPQSFLSGSAFCKCVFSRKLNLEMACDILSDLIMPGTNGSCAYEMPDELMVWSFDKVRSLQK